MKLVVAFSPLLSLLVSAQFVSFQPSGAPFSVPVTTAAGLSAHVLFSNLTVPRGVTIDAQNHLLVVERGLGLTVFAPQEDPVGWSRKLLLSNAGLTQGVQVDNDKLYVSTSSQVLVYTYDAVAQTVDLGTEHILVDSLPADGELQTHTLQLVRGGTYILVATGPKENVDVTARDPSSGRSQVRAFSTASSASWIDGTLIAYGIRNPAGIAEALDHSGVWIVENGASIDAGLGAGTNFTTTFVNDNPADELEFVPATKLGKSYGFPDCTTLWNGDADPVGEPGFVGKPRGYQFSLGLEPSRDDAWCGNKTNNVPPAVSFQAHSVPLDIKFYECGSPDGLPSSWVGDAFVSFHGSFNRSPPTGYGVVRVPFIGSTPASQSYDFIIQAVGLAVFRPVGLVFGLDGKLYGTSDASGELYVVQRE